MTFRVAVIAPDPNAVISCEGHLDRDALAHIKRALAVLTASGAPAVIRLCRGATADRDVVVALAGLGSQLEVDSPFLRAWIDRVRGQSANGRPGPASGQ